MNVNSLHTPPADPVVYPDDDGLPMSDNTLQYQWIVTLQTNLAYLFGGRPDVFVAGNHLIYAVRGDVKARQAPDVYVAFGRPTIYRGSYKVWEEDGIFPQVVFEVWSPNNRPPTMKKKFAFYEKHGAEEYYIVYPGDAAHVKGWTRDADKLVPVPQANGWTSPRLGIRFEVVLGVLTVYGPAGQPFRPPEEIAAERDAAEQKAARLAARLRELGVDPDAV